MNVKKKGKRGRGGERDEPLVDDQLENRPQEELVCGRGPRVSPGHAELRRRTMKAAEGQARLNVTASTLSSGDQLRRATIVGVWRREEGNQVGNKVGRAASRAKRC